MVAARAEDRGRDFALVVSSRRRCLMLGDGDGDDDGEQGRDDGAVGRRTR